MSPRRVSASRQGSPDGERARLYRAITRVFGERYDEGMRDLASIDKARLPARDGELLDATRQLAAQLRKWPEGTEPGQRTMPSADAPPPSKLDGASAANKTIDQAQKLLGDVNKMLKEAGQ